MGSSNKPKLSISKQISLLKSKGVTFSKYSEKNALKFLQQNSYLFRVKSYCNTYKKRDSHGVTKKYTNLDFAYLVDLSVIDMHFRRFLLRLTLDIEHLLKTKIIRDFNTSSDNGYEIVEEFLSNNNYANDYIDNQIKKAKEIKNKNKDFSSAVHFILYNYERDLAIWNFIEIIQFGNFLEFAKFFYAKYSNVEFRNIKNSIFNVKFLRNSCAHNNCILADLKNNIQAPQRETIDRIMSLKIFKNKTRNFIAQQMENRTINDFITALFVYDKICKSEKMKYYCYQELLTLCKDRFSRNKEFYKTNKTIRDRYLFCLRIAIFLKNKHNLTNNSI